MATGKAVRWGTLLDAAVVRRCSSDEGCKSGGETSPHRRARGLQREAARLRANDPGKADHALHVCRGSGLHLDVGVAAGVDVVDLAGRPGERSRADEPETLVAGRIDVRVDRPE